MPLLCAEALILQRPDTRLLSIFSFANKANCFMDVKGSGKINSGENYFLAEGVLHSRYAEPPNTRTPFRLLLKLTFFRI